MINFFLISALLIGCAPSDPEPDPGWMQENCQVLEYDVQMCDIALLDQDSNLVVLSRLIENGPVLVDFSTMWCKPCQHAAQYVQSIQDDYEDSNLTYVTILIDDIEGNTPGTDDAAEWSTFFEITAPVLAGSRVLSVSEGGPFYLPAWPMFFYVKGGNAETPGTVSYFHSGFSEEVIRTNLDILILED